mmetsp:Transcript_6307/g.39289  ORF Transcript_6307/g.39289 Transcript_6307/m.39289 type:complete len:291 (-) Transcript_6307:935-1807(-)
MDMCTEIPSVVTVQEQPHHNKGFDLYIRSRAFFCNHFEQLGQDGFHVLCESTGQACHQLMQQLEGRELSLARLPSQLFVDVVEQWGQCLLQVMSGFLRNLGRAQVGHAGLSQQIHEHLVDVDPHVFFSLFHPLEQGAGEVLVQVAQLVRHGLDDGGEQLGRCSSHLPAGVFVVAVFVLLLPIVRAVIIPFLALGSRTLRSRFFRLRFVVVIGIVFEVFDADGHHVVHVGSHGGVAFAHHGFQGLEAQFQLFHCHVFFLLRKFCCIAHALQQGREEVLDVRVHPFAVLSHE